MSVAERFRPRRQKIGNMPSFVRETGSNGQKTLKLLNFVHEIGSRGQEINNQ